MDLCWTSTSASAGEDFIIRAEWRSMALKVGYKALCNNNKKKCILQWAVRSKLWVLQKQASGNYGKKRKTTTFFELTVTHFVWNSCYSFEGVSWALWGYETSSSSQGSLTVLMLKCLLRFYSELQWEPQVAFESQTCWIVWWLRRCRTQGGIN